jgi:hypothetical protein
MQTTVMVYKETRLCPSLFLHINGIRHAKGTDNMTLQRNRDSRLGQQA